MNKIPLAALALGLAVSTAWAQTAWAQTAETKPAAAAAAGTKAALTVNVVSPRAGQWTSTLPLNGNIAAWGEAIIGSQVGGLRVVEVLANVGDSVRRGQLLARISSDNVAADAAQARAGLAEAQAMGYSPEDSLYKALFATPANLKVKWPDAVAKGHDNHVAKLWKLLKSRRQA